MNTVADEHAACQVDHEAQRAPIRPCDAETRWGPCKLCGYIPKWCPRRFDNPDQLLRALGQTASRINDEWFVELAAVCSACRIDVRERIGIEALLDAFVGCAGEDEVGALGDLDDVAPEFDPRPRSHERAHPVKAKPIRPIRQVAKAVAR